MVIKLINKVSKSILTKSRLPLILLGVFVSAVALVMLLADNTVTYITGTITILAYLFLLRLAKFSSRK